MDCVRAEKEIMLNHTDDKQVAEHLCECEQCRAIAESLKDFISVNSTVEKYKVPKALDKSITSEAQAFIKERTGQYPAAKAVVKSSHNWSLIIFYAACFIITALIVIFILSSGKGASSGATDDYKMTVNTPFTAEAGKWENIDMSDELFILNTQIEINFAALSIIDDEEEESESDGGDNEENPLEFLELTI